MIVLFELFKYETNLLRKLIPNEFLSSLNDPMYSTTEYVGYTYYSNTEEQFSDYVFILPKIFVDDNGKAFGKYDPLLFTDFSNNFINCSLDKKTRIFINELSCWLYKSLLVYKNRSTQQNDILGLHEASLPQVISSNEANKTHTLLDLYFAFLCFYKKNNNLFVFHYINSKNGYKINWTKTITHNLPIIIDDTPVYNNLNTKKTSITCEDKLILLFYSVLYYYKNFYNFDVTFKFEFKIIKGIKFNQLLEGKGLRLLKKIKNHYFKDTFKNLWDLLYLFFDYETNNKISKNVNEVLLTKYYPAVFEDMIDSLLGDDINNIAEIKRYYKDQKDGRIVDHIYNYKDLLNDSNIYYIGDSKYYKIGHDVRDVALEKQFTYAKNVIQYNIDELNLKQNINCIRYRDNLTEGYNITPNFFISAILDTSLTSISPNLTAVGKPVTHFHFNNRLFDRDTLTVQRYNINFLYVLTTYISKDEYNKIKFKKDTRIKFKNIIISFLNNEYFFYKLWPKKGTSLEEFVNINFKYLNGKTYKPLQTSEFIFVALKSSEYNNEIMALQELEKLTLVGTITSFKL